MTASRTRSLSSSISWIRWNRTFRASRYPPELGQPQHEDWHFIFTGIDESIQHSFPHLAQGMDTAIPSNVYSSSVEILRALSNSGAAAVAEGPIVARAVIMARPVLPDPPKPRSMLAGHPACLAHWRHLAQIHGSITSDSGVLQSRAPPHVAKD